MKIEIAILYLNTFLSMQRNSFFFPLFKVETEIADVIVRDIPVAQNTQAETQRPCNGKSWKLDYVSHVLKF